MSQILAYTGYKYSFIEVALQTLSEGMGGNIVLWGLAIFIAVITYKRGFSLNPEENKTDRLIMRLAFIVASLFALYYLAVYLMMLTENLKYNNDGSGLAYSGNLIGYLSQAGLIELWCISVFFAVKYFVRSFSEKYRRRL